MIKYIYNLQHFKDFYKENCTGNFTDGYTVKLSKIKKVRSLPQNNTYWLYLTCIEQETGQNKDSLHEYFKDKFIKKQLIEIFDTQVLTTPTTRKLKVKEFNEYLKKIEIFAATELQITLPDPSAKEFESFVEFYSDFL